MGQFGFSVRDRGVSRDCQEPELTRYPGRMGASAGEELDVDVLGVVSSLAEVVP